MFYGFSDGRGTGKDSKIKSREMIEMKINANLFSIPIEKRYTDEELKLINVLSRMIKHCIIDKQNNDQVFCDKESNICIMLDPEDYNFFKDKKTIQDTIVSLKNRFINIKLDEFELPFDLIDCRSFYDDKGKCLFIIISHVISNIIIKLTSDNTTIELNPNLNPNLKRNRI